MPSGSMAPPCLAAVWSSPISRAVNDATVARCAGKPGSLASPVGGDVITAVYPGFSGGTVATASEYTGVSALHVRRTQIGNSAKPTSGTITTTRPDTLLLSVISHNGPSRLTMSSGFSQYCAAIVGGGSSQKTIDVGYQVGVPPGTYAAGGTLSSAARWRAVILAYS